VIAVRSEDCRRLRVWFAKSGRAAYISHLDLNRCMTRAVRRARLPLWYTEGFNPHPYITFALPLPLGQEGEAEPMDIRVEGDMEPEEIKNRLAAVMPEGLSVTGVDTPRLEPKEIGCAEYEIVLDFANEAEARLFAEKAAELINNEELTAGKPGKQGGKKVMKQVALSAYIREHSLACEQNRVCLKTTLAAGNTTNLNPDLLLDSLRHATGLEEANKRIVRKRLLTADFQAFR